MLYIYIYENYTSLCVLLKLHKWFCNIKTENYEFKLGKYCKVSARFFRSLKMIMTCSIY